MPVKVRTTPRPVSPRLRRIRIEFRRLFAQQGLPVMPHRPANTGHTWVNGQCYVCKKQTKVRYVNFFKPAVPLAACGPHARRWELLPFEQRIMRRNKP